MTNDSSSDIPDLEIKGSVYVLGELFAVKTYTNDLVLGTSGKVSSIRAEANAADVEVAFSVGVTILQVADLLAGVDIEDLSRSVAASSNETTVMAEAYAADDTLVRQVMHKIHVESAWHARVKDSMPILTLALQVGWKLLRFQFTQLVANLLELTVCVLEIRGDLLGLVGWWSWSCNAGGAWVWVRWLLLWRSWTTKTGRSAANAWFTWARGLSGLRLLAVT